MSSAPRQTLEASANAKVLLLGEHLIFHGAPALGLPLPLLLKAHLEQQDQQEYTDPEHAASSAFTLHSSISIPPDFVAQIQHICKQQTLHLPQGTVCITSDIPLDSGLGSSAALCSAVAQIILQFNHRTVTKIQAWTLAHQFEQFFHSPASGIDTALATFSTPLVITSDTTDSTGVGLLLTETRISIPIVVATVAREVSSAALIQRVAKELHNSEKLPLLKQLNQNALRFLHHHAPEQSLISFASTINAIHQLFVELQLSTTAMEEGIATARRAGAIAAKLSGAGAGGAFVCFCADQTQATQVTQALQNTEQVHTVLQLPASATGST